MAVDAKTIFEAISKPPIELLAERGMGLYIPSYQRPYSWDKEKVNRLLEDLGHGIKILLKSNDSFTFLGTVITIHDTNNSTVQPIVRADVPSKVLTVIDGQQRMTTLLVLCLALHNQIKIVHKKFSKKKTSVENALNSQQQSNLDFGEEANSEVDNILQAFEWLDGQAKSVLSDLENVFFEKHAFGRSPLYPRMIRSLDDQWSRDANQKKYQSPIANLIFNYIIQIDDPQYQPVDYKPMKREGNIEGEDAIVDRFNQIIKSLSSLSIKKSRAGEMEEVPSIEEVYANQEFQISLLNHPMPTEYIKLIKNSEKEIFDELLLLVVYARYVLHRVVLTVVKGKNEDYAFTIFESLNTTGEPLTAFETFKPRVVNAVGLADYDGSDEKALMDEIGNYLSQFPVGKKLQTATKDLLIQFFSAYSGEKVSGRLAEQRSALKEAFEKAVSPFDFINTLATTARFKANIWEAKNLNTSISDFGGYELSSVSKLALKFFNDIDHSTVIPVLTVFFRQIQQASTPEECKQRFNEFESALQGMFAFSVLWRATGRGTSGIDNEYREILNKHDMPTGLNPVSVKHSNNSVVDISLFKAELKSRLLDEERKGKLKDRDTFIQNSYTRPAYKSAKLAKVLLLAAHHNAVENQNNDGLISKGRESVNPCLTIDQYIDKVSFSLEHIAPQGNNGKWDTEIYTTPDLVDSLGNLILVSHSLNSSMSNRMWAEKQVFYQVVGAKTPEIAGSILAKAAESNGISFREHTKDMLSAQKYMPNLVAIGNYNGKWSKEFIEFRSKHLYGLAWDELIQFLE